MLTEAKETLSEEDALKLLKTSARRSHATAKQAPIFACYKGAPDFFTLKEPLPIGSYIIDKAAKELRLNNRGDATVLGFTNAELAQREQDGELYVVFPFDSARIGVSPTEDFYKSFKVANAELRINSVNNHSLEEALEFLGEFETWAQLKKLLEDGEPQRLKGDKQQARFNSYQKSHTGLLWFKKLFDFEANGFISLLPYQAAPAMREVWVTGPALLVRAEQYDELYKQGLV